MHKAATGKATLEVRKGENKLRAQSKEKYVLNEYGKYSVKMNNGTEMDSITVSLGDSIVAKFHTNSDIQIHNLPDESHPKRHFTAQLNGYNFNEDNIKQLIQKECGVCINKEDNFTMDKILEYLNFGKEHGILCPKDFQISELINF